jgi:hypothetical protein
VAGPEQVLRHSKGNSSSMRGASRSPKALQKRGLNNQLTDPAAIFLYRGEALEVTERLGIDWLR